MRSRNRNIDNTKKSPERVQDPCPDNELPPWAPVTCTDDYAILWPHHIRAIPSSCI
jgi:hypothetical protein